MSAQLDLINAMLRTVGEFAVDSELDSHPDVSTCKAIIEDQRKSLLGKGYWFNNPTVDLFPTVNNEIFIPDTTLTVDATDTTRNVSMRGDRLYDNDNDTFTFTDKINCEFVLDIPELDDIPYVALMVIKWRSVLEFAGIQQVTGEPIKNAQGFLVDAENNLTAERYRKADTNWNNTPLVQQMFAFRVKGSTTRKRGYTGAGYSRLRKTVV